MRADHSGGVDGRPKQLVQVVADRLCGKLAERRIRQRELMLAFGWSQATASRKMNGKSPMTLDELDTLWQTFRISPLELLSGGDDDPQRPDGASYQDRTGDRSLTKRRVTLRIVSSDTAPMLTSAA